MYHFSFHQNETTKLLNAGCAEKVWNYHEKHGKLYAYTYQWVGKGQILGRGVCIKTTYVRNKPPGNPITTVYGTIIRQHVREINEKKKTIVVEFTLKMRWLDPGIRKGEKIINSNIISLSDSSLNKIWIPDLHIRNRSSFKIDKEWYSIVNAKIMSTDETNQIRPKEGEHATGVEVTYEIKTSVYCPFDFANYPMDTQTCMIGFGSRSPETQFKLYDRNKKYHNFSNYVETKFNICVEFRNLTFEDVVIIGMDINMTRLSEPYMMEYYMPCIGIMLVSEIGFVVPVTAIPGRIGLLVTQFLTLMNLFIHQMVICILRLSSNM